MLALVCWTLYSIYAQRFFAPGVTQLRRTLVAITGALPWMIGCWLLMWATGAPGPPLLGADRRAVVGRVGAEEGGCRGAGVHDWPGGMLARGGGMVTVRQQPETAKGAMFVSLEDETGSVQVIVWPKLKAQLRGPLLRSKLMAVKGTWQRDGDVRNLIAGHVEDLTALLGGLSLIHISEPTRPY